MPVLQLLTLDVQRLRFPSSCVRCGGAPESSVRLRGSGGIDAPLCMACRSRADLTRGAAVLLVLVTVVALVVATAVLLDLLLPLPDTAADRRRLAMVVVVGLFVFAGAAATLGVRAVLRAHAQRFFPVIFVRRDADAVVLAFRDAALARAVAARSGLGTGDEYRAAAPARGAWRPGPSPIDRLALSGVAAALAVTATIRAWMVITWTELGTVHWVEAMLLAAGGIPALVAFWGFVGAACASVSVRASVSLVRAALGARTSRHD